MGIRVELETLSNHETDTLKYDLTSRPTKNQPYIQ